MQTDINAAYFKSIIDQDRCSVVICNLKHEIIYMNPTAVKSYEKWGGESLVGRSLLNCHNEESQKRIQQVIDWFAADESHNLMGHIWIVPVDICLQYIEVQTMLTINVPQHPFKM